MAADMLIVEINAVKTFTKRFFRKQLFLIWKNGDVWTLPVRYYDVSGYVKQNIYGDFV